MDYFAKNTGTEDNEFQFTPTLVAQGKEYMGAAFTITVQVFVNGVEFNELTSVSDVYHSQSEDKEQLFCSNS